MLGSTLTFFTSSEMNSRLVMFNGLGASGTATAGQSTNLDLQIADDCFLTGGILLAKTAAFGDYAQMQVVDKDGVYYPANTVLRQFVTNYYMRSDAEEQLNLNLSYPAKIYGGLYLRVVYVSTGTINVSVAVNYLLHKALL